MAALAAVSDLEARLGRTLSGTELSRATALLDDASAAVRGYTGQELTAGTSTNKRLRARGGVVTLPQRPVTAVTSVTDTDGNAVGYTWDGWDRLGVVPELEAVLVTYNHGYDTVPDVIVAVVCQVAGRALGTPPDGSGFTQETIGGYSYTIGGTAAAGALGLLPAELEALETFQRRASRSRITML